MTGSEASSPLTAFDIVVKNLTYYQPHKYEWTTIQGSFGQINMAAPPTADDADTSTTFEFCAVQTGRPASETLTLDIFPMTFYDLCAPPSQKGSCM